VKREAEVVVAREHDHVASVEPDTAALLCFDDVVIRGVLEPHFRRMVITTAIEERLGVLGLGKEGQGHRLKSRRLGTAGKDSSVFLEMTRNSGRAGAERIHPVEERVGVLAPGSETSSSCFAGELGECVGALQERIDCPSDCGGSHFVESERTTT